MTSPKPPKLHAALARAGYASRRTAEEWIKAGRVQLNGRRAKLGERVGPDDQVRVDGQVVSLEPASALVLAVNKPVGLVSTTKDELGRATVLSLLPPQYEKIRLYPVGRLDQDSQGLLLLTNDGDMAHLLTHPKFQIEKEYWVQLDRAPSQAALNHLRSGVQLNDGLATPLQVTHLAKRGVSWFSIVISEGRNRQVRRMIRRVGYEVKTLIRVRIGQFRLDSLKQNTWQKLSAQDQELLFK